MDCLFTGDFIVFWQGEYRGTKTDRIAEWIENDLNIPVEEYRKLAEQFNPTGFHADDFVKRAKNSGA